MPPSTSDNVDGALCGMEPRRERRRVLPAFLGNRLLLFLTTTSVLRRDFFSLLVYFVNETEHYF